MSHGAASRLFVHVEEPSMEAVMTALLPRLLNGRSIDPKVIGHNSKQALLANLPARLRGYADWREPGLRILVLVDRDDDDCRALKGQLEEMARAAGLPTKAAPDRSGQFRVVNRVVIEELEAWFLGDVPALSGAYPGVPSTLGSRAKFRDPDAVVGGTWEALLGVLVRAGHYTASHRLPKIEVARRIAPLMSVTENRSGSFQAFLAGVDALLAI